MNADIIEKTENFVKERLSGEGTGHDWWHAARIINTAKQTANRSDKFMAEWNGER